MKSRKAIVGTVVLGALALVSILGTVTGQHAVADAARTALLLATGVLVLVGVIAQRRLGRLVDSTYRKVEHIYRKGALSRGGAQPEVAKDDLVGMLRLVQAQYVGRLDQALSTLEHATEHLTASPTTAEGPSSGPTVLTAQPRDEHAPAVEAAIESGIRVIINGSTEEAQRWVARHGWQGRVTLAELRNLTDAGASDE